MKLTKEKQNSIENRYSEIRKPKIQNHIGGLFGLCIDDSENGTTQVFTNGEVLCGIDGVKNLIDELTDFATAIEEVTGIC